MTKTLTILGSTGSIGESTLRVAESLGEDIDVIGLTCKRNLSILENQIVKYNPLFVAVESKETILSSEFKKLKDKFPLVEFLTGEDGVIEVASKKSDIVVSAIVGSAGLKPSLAALKSCKRMALANKETLVMAGDLFMNLVKENDVELIPVDSEHSAIFSLLEHMDSDEVERIIITASGGSLRDMEPSEFKDVTPEIALSHPTWSMGSKITIDSATLMNKGLEVIEAHHLFGYSYDKIDVIIHPESVVHSMVETIDGAIYAHMGVTDMVFPILNSIHYPNKVKNPFGKLRLEDVGSLTFRKYNKNRDPALELCFEAGRAGGTMPAVLNAANEVAVYAFLDKKILFVDIVKIVKKTMQEHQKIENPTLEDIFEADKVARLRAKSLIGE